MKQHVCSRMKCAFHVHTPIRRPGNAGRDQDRVIRAIRDGDFRNRFYP
ncbi:MAG: hypothetical protein R6V10_16340 [bacterium]